MRPLRIVARPFRRSGRLTPQYARSGAATQEQVAEIRLRGRMRHSGEIAFTESENIETRQAAPRDLIGAIYTPTALASGGSMRNISPMPCVRAFDRGGPVPVLTRHRQLVTRCRPYMLGVSRFYCVAYARCGRITYQIYAQLRSTTGRSNDASQALPELAAQVDAALRRMSRASKEGAPPPCFRVPDFPHLSLSLIRQLAGVAPVRAHASIVGLFYARRAKPASQEGQDR